MDIATSTSNYQKGHGDQARARQAPLLDVGSVEIRRAWSDRVITEVLAFNPDALKCRQGVAV
jgi:hypothetical protein